MNNTATNKVVPFNSSNARIPKNLHIVDTSALFHDPKAILQFKEHDVYLCDQVMTEIDHRKVGQSDVARNARQVTRMIDDIFHGDRSLMRNGASLVDISGGSATGKIFMQMEDLKFSLPKGLTRGGGDREIIRAACHLRKTRDEYAKIVLVTKDTSMRYAAMRVTKVDIHAEDYKNDKVLLKDADVLPTGMHELPDDFWENHEIHYGDGGTPLTVKGPLCGQFMINECLETVEKGKNIFLKVRDQYDDIMVLERVVNYMADKHAVHGVLARNKEQVCAFSHLMEPETTLAILLGDAGVGKTFLTLAAAIKHLLHGKQSEFGINKIIVTRALVPVGGEELGFLPGDIKEKAGPWFLAIEDALEGIFKNAKKRKSWDEAQIESIRKDIHIQPIGMIAGRTLQDCVVIVDEAQNLTPYQTRMLITRAGDGARFVFLGNLAQIDTPYLDEMSSGLANIVMRMRGHKQVGHVILQECVRSALASLAIEHL